MTTNRFPALLSCYIRYILIISLTQLSYPLSLKAEEHSFYGSAQPFIHSPVTAPTVPFFGEQNQVLRLQDFQGKLILVNLWASWCTACIHEMPDLAALQLRLGGKGLRVLTLNQDMTDSAEIRRLLDRQGGTNLPAYRDISMLFGTAVNQKLLPMTLLYTRQGKGVGYLVGPADWDSDEVVDFLTDYL